MNLKAKLSEYLDKAKLGDEIIVTDHRKPIARLIKEPNKQKSKIEKMYFLAAQGLVQLPSKEKKAKSNSLFKSKSNAGSRTTCRMNICSRPFSFLGVCVCISPRVIPPLMWALSTSQPCKVFCMEA